MEFSNLINSFYNYYIEEKKNIKWEPLGLITPVFPHTFNPSAGHTQTVELLQSFPQKQPSRFRAFFIERCFRDVDMRKVGLSPFYLSFFEMPEDFYFWDSLLKETIIEDFLNFMNKRLNVNLDKLLFSTFKGGKTYGYDFQKDIESIRSLNKLGISESHIIKSSSNFVIPSAENDFGCPRIEIYYDRGDKYKNYYRFLEIGTIEFITHTLKRINGRLRLIPLKEDSNPVLGIVAYGLERLNMALEGKETIYDIDILNFLKEIIQRYLPNKNYSLIYEKEINIIVDHIRAATFIIAEGQLPDSSRRGGILKRVLRAVFENAIFLEILNWEMFQEMIKTIVEIYKKRLPHLENSEGIILETTQNKFKLIEKDFREKKYE
ncbi:MAG: alanine--tRNA ligase-related protein [Nitrospirota bacterium]|nr:alanine--tRNA ligase-related protein [Nitrospirota bacterium]